MRWLRDVFAVARQNFRKWQTDYRIWVIAAMLLVFTQFFIDDFRMVSKDLNLPMPIWIFPFLYPHYVNKLVMTFPVILMFCNAPFIDRNQVFMLMRTGRTKWLCGQIVYIMLASAVYYIYLLVLTLVNTVFVGEISLDWGIMLRTATPDIIANTGAASYLVDSVSNTVLTFFTPLSAVWFTFLMSWCSATLLGLIIYFFNFVTETKGIGMCAAAILLVFGSIAGFPDQRNIPLLKFSPIAWNTLNNIDVGGLTNKPSFTYCISVYAIFITVLIAGILIFGRKKSIDINRA